jgi:hypothetical protein
LPLIKVRKSKTISLPHNFKINDLVWYEDFSPLGKNAKLTPKWQGPAKITEINDTNARILLANGKTKILNIMRIKKFFKSENSNNENKTVSGSDELNFNAKSEFTGPVTRGMKKLLEQQNATNLAISVLCDLSKKHCSMCEWEQECSDNPLLFDPMFARQYIKDRKSWLINKQSMCAKCKLQLGEHLIDNQAASNSIHQQCHDFSKSDKVPIAKSDAKVFTDNFPFQEFNSHELIKKQNDLRDAQNLINAQENARVFNQNDDIGPTQFRIRNRNCWTPTSSSRASYNYCSGLPVNTQHPHSTFTLGCHSTSPD